MHVDLKAVLLAVSTVCAAVPAVTAAVKRRIDYIAISLATLAAAFLVAVAMKG